LECGVARETNTTSSGTNDFILSPFQAIIISREIEPTKASSNPTSHHRLSPLISPISIMIVDFPSCCSELEPITEQQAAVVSKSKSVRFSPNSTMYQFRYPTKEENKSKWYSWQEEATFKRQRWRDVAHYSLSMTQREAATSPNELLLKCVGIDHLISRDVIAKAEEIECARKEHVRTVLERQEMLWRHGVEDIDDLAQVSMSSSRFARKKSHSIAVMISGLL
jgi:hypothetical protein